MKRVVPIVVTDDRVTRDLLEAIGIIRDEAWSLYRRADEYEESSPSIAARTYAEADEYMALAIRIRAAFQLDEVES